MSWFAYITVWTVGTAGALLVLVTDAYSRLLLLLCLGVVYAGTLLIGSAFPKLGLHYRALNRGSASTGSVSLIFEGGPHSRLTPRLLELLKRESVPAAFFMVGQAAEANAALVKRAAAEGHLIGSHLYSHSAGWAVSTNPKLRAELERATQTLQKIIRRSPCFVRLPLGFSRPGVAGIFQALNIIPVGWDVRAWEFVYREPEAIARRIARLARNGSIILLHEGFYSRDQSESASVLATVRQAIDLLRERGFIFARLDQLLGLPGYAGK